MTYPQLVEHYQAFVKRVKTKNPAKMSVYELLKAYELQDVPMEFDMETGEWFIEHESLRMTISSLEKVRQIGKVVSKYREVMKERAGKSASQPEKKPEAQPEKTVTPSATSASQGFNEGDRVQWTKQNGDTLTGKIKSIHDGKARVDVDQIAEAGGVPIGRVEIVNTSRLEKEVVEPVEKPTPKKKTEQAKETIENVKNSDMAAFLERQAELARKRLKDRQKNTLGANLPFADMGDYTIIGVNMLFKKSMDLAEFTIAMVEEFGPMIEKHVPGIYGQASAMTKWTQDDLLEYIVESQNAGKEEAVTSIEELRAEDEKLKQEKEGVTPSATEASDVPFHALLEEDYLAMPEEEFKNKVRNETGFDNLRAIARTFGLYTEKGSFPGLIIENILKAYNARKHGPSEDVYDDEDYDQYEEESPQNEPKVKKDEALEKELTKAAVEIPTVTEFFNTFVKENKERLKKAGYTPVKLDDLYKAHAGKREELEQKKQEAERKARREAERKAQREYDDFPIVDIATHPKADLVKVVRNWIKENEIKSLDQFEELHDA